MFATTLVKSAGQFDVNASAEIKSNWLEDISGAKASFKCSTAPSSISIAVNLHPVSRRTSVSTPGPGPISRM